MKASDTFPEEEPPGYRVRKREIQALRNQLSVHPNGLDPLCPDVTHEEVDEMERELEREVW